MSSSETPEASLDPGLPYHELGEAAGAALAEAHSLTMAMARLELALARQSRSASLTEDGAADAARTRAAAAGEFLERLARAVMVHLNAIKEWLAKAVASIVEHVFGPREAWLERMKHDILAARDFGGAEVDLGSQVLRESPAGLAHGLEAAVNAALSAASRPQAGGEGVADRVREAYERWTGARRAGASTAAQLAERFIGEPGRVALTAQTAGALVRAAEATFDNARQFSALRREIDAQIAVVRGLAKGSGDEAARASQLRAISTAAAMTSAAISAGVAVNSRINSQAMAALVHAARAAHASRPVAESAAPRLPSVLDAYMAA